MILSLLWLVTVITGKYFIKRFFGRNVAISLDCTAIFSEKVAMRFKIITNKDKFNQGRENDPSIFLKFNFKSIESVKFNLHLIWHSFSALNSVRECPWGQTWIRSFTGYYHL